MFSPVTTKHLQMNAAKNFPLESLLRELPLLTAPMLGKLINRLHGGHALTFKFHNNLPTRENLSQIENVCFPHGYDWVEFQT